MRAALLSLALCCLVQFATPQTVVYTLSNVGSSGVSYTIRIADADIDFAGGDPCPAGESLAVWESKEDYKDFIMAMKAEPVDDGAIIMTGLGTGDGRGTSRTYNGGRPAPFVNFHDSSEIYEVTDKAGDFCARLMFTPNANANFLNSRWFFDGLILPAGDHFACMDARDADCADTDSCFRTPRDDRVPDSTCFWRPKPQSLFSWKEAKEVCYKHGGHLMNLIDDDDIDLIKAWTKNDPTTISLWLGLEQKPGQGYPTWRDGIDVDEQDAWESRINYGSSLNYFPYAGVWNRNSEAMNLYRVATGLGQETKALAACEATKEHYCIYSSKKVKYAEKSVCCDEEKLRYTCQPGFEFPDGETEKEIDCGCDVDFDDLYVPDCILKNPCLYDNKLCQPHGECVFTNQYQRPYYCVCGPGFKWDDHKQNCVDIDECKNDMCGHYNGHCINTIGAYACQCSQGYGWESEVCKATPNKNPVVSVHTMTMFFTVQMDYNSDMNDPNTADYENLEEALEELTRGVYYPDRISVVSFEVSPEEFGWMKVKVVFDLYFAADVKTVSKYVWKFYNYIKNADYFMVKGNPYPYYGSIYFKSPTISSNIAITSPCSIYDHTNQCHGSFCQVDDLYTPVCHCRPNSYGEFCDENQPKPHGDLSDTEIGLIVAVCVLFVMLLCLPCCMMCCYMHCRCLHPRKRVHHNDQQYVSSNVYGTPYVAKPAHVATRYPAGITRITHA